MKSLFLILLSMLMNFSSVWAQGRLGIQFSPVMPVYHISHVQDGNTLSVTSPGIRPVFSLSVDIPLGQTYFIGTGASYMSTPLHVMYLSDDGLETTNNYKLQHIQIPLTLRMLTDEIAIDKRIYVQIGSLMEVLVYNDNTNSRPVLIERFNPVTFTFYIGAGVEFHLGTRTLITTGLSYNRGISNMISEDNTGNSILLKKDMFSLDIGIRF